MIKVFQFLDQKYRRKYPIYEGDTKFESYLTSYHLALRSNGRGDSLIFGVSENLNGIQSIEEPYDAVDFTTVGNDGLTLLESYSKDIITRNKMLHICITALNMVISNFNHDWILHVSAANLLTVTYVDDRQELAQAIIDSNNILMFRRSDAEVLLLDQILKGTGIYARTFRKALPGSV